MRMKCRGNVRIYGWEELLKKITRRRVNDVGCTRVFFNLLAKRYISTLIPTEIDNELGLAKLFGTL